MASCGAAGAVAFALLLLLAAADASPASPAADPFAHSRITVTVDVGRRRQPFPLRFPKLKPLAPGVPTAFRLTVNDTCGLFTLFHTVSQPAGAGPPPHVHYNDDEYFISAGPGVTRVYTHQKEQLFKPGRLPGFNVPPVACGSVLFNGTGDGVTTWGGQLALSPAGSVHYFARETHVRDFFTVYLDGFADAEIINFVLYNTYTPYELLAFSGLYAIPTDSTGAFVGLLDPTPNATQKLYRQARGPIDVPDAREAARRLQRLFDIVEARGCCRECL